MRESRTYGSGRGACHEMHVPTATPPRVHHAARRCGGGVAARGARAAAEDAASVSSASCRGGAALCCVSKRMAELGYQQGQNFTFEYIQAPRIEGYELTYRELTERKVDIMLAAGNEPALRAARAAGGPTPIVFIAVDFDPVEKGYVASLSRPGSNMTGIFGSVLELAGKRVALLRETFPKARRVGLLWDATSREQAVAAEAGPESWASSCVCSN